MACGPDGAPRFATLLVRSGAGMTHTLRFSSDTSAVIDEHRGDTTTFELHLSALQWPSIRRACPDRNLRPGGLARLDHSDSHAKRAGDNARPISAAGGESRRLSPV